MRYWFRGKRGGLIAYVLISAIFLGGLTWGTVAALDMEEQARREQIRHELEQRQARAQREREQRQAQAQAELTKNLRLAMWRLDSFIFADLDKEAGRPFHEYQVRSAFELPYEQPFLSAALLPNLDLAHPQGALLRALTARPVPPVKVYEIAALASDLVGVEALKTRHFLLTLSSDWKTPDAVYGTLGLNRPRAKQTPALADQPLLAELSRDLNLSFLMVQAPVPSELPADPVAQNGVGRSPNQQPQPQQQAFANPTFGQFQGQEYNPYLTNNAPIGQRGGGNTDQQQKQDLDSKMRTDLDNRRQNAFSYNRNLIDNNLDGPRSLMAIPGSTARFWVKLGGEHALVLGRMIQIARMTQVNDRTIQFNDNKQVCQIIFLDWPAVQELLSTRVNDLFPKAQFKPIALEGPPDPERVMTALPIEMDPGGVEIPAAAVAGVVEPAAAEATDLGWTPLRMGLLLAWIAALVALLAVGLGGWSLLDLSERRIRFVSAVTHELRTPLTTLRLYLDMLNSGMVKDEERQSEYLRTLDAEANRLNRLVCNVLDFSRLENQRPRLELVPVPIGEFLEDVYLTWHDRCRDAEKELLAENQVGAETTVRTDVKLVYQILGNLIDNACKYSREAEDRRLWLRARRADRHLVLEVEDRGPGVPAPDNRLIFRPFRRGRSADASTGGVGLGLALAQRWAQLLGGRLTLHSGPDGVGACFRLELPWTEANAG
jgi:signal transduction histidine kinase